MPLWRIFILGSLRLNCNWDYDELQEIANSHRTLRQILGHGILDIEKRYPRHQHAAVESAIHAPENHSLDWCCDHGLVGFERYVAFAIIARNIQLIGQILQERELDCLRKSQLRRLCSKAA